MRRYFYAGVIFPIRFLGAFRYSAFPTRPRPSTCVPEMITSPKSPRKSNDDRREQRRISAANCTLVRGIKGRREIKKSNYPIAKPTTRCSWYVQRTRYRGNEGSLWKVEGRGSEKSLSKAIHRPIPFFPHLFHFFSPARSPLCLAAQTK